MNVTVGGRTQHYRTVSFDAANNAVLLVAQRLLPHELKIVAARDYRETARAIKEMTVRGAGAIGAAAAFGLAQGARAYSGDNLDLFSEYLETVVGTLKSARPTAVDPLNALIRVRNSMRGGTTVLEQQQMALSCARHFADEDVEHCQAIGRHGLKLIRNGMKILTHCNAGWLAFVDVGTATAPIYEAQAQGKNVHVFCDETRPRSQGAT